MTLAEEIREFVNIHYLEIARNGWKKETRIRVGDIHCEMRLRSRYQAVIAALETKLFERKYSVRRIATTGNGANRAFVFKVSQRRPRGF